MQSNIFQAGDFVFPYDYKFPGQASDENILFVTRENKSLLLLRQLFILLTALLFLALAFALGDFLQNWTNLAIYLKFFALILAVVMVFVSWWWVNKIWLKSLAIVTNKRLTKIIYTTPFNRHSLSLPLEMIVDTGSYTKGFIQALFKLATFTARSSASSSGVATDDTARVNKKYFYIENIAIAEDLQHYVNKLLEAQKHQRDKLDKFRPFVPNLKGERRKEFMKNYPDYWS